MNKEQAVTYLKFSGFSDEQIKAIEGAFSCPSAGVDCEDCPAYEDAISRKAVLDTLERMDKALDEDRTVESYKELLRECYKVLPSVTPKPKVGHWIDDGQYADGHSEHACRCSKCGYTYIGYTDKYKECPNCGAKMTESEEKPKSEWQHDHEILKAYSDGASAVLDNIRAEIDTARFVDKDTKHCRNANATGLEVALDIIDKYMEEKGDKE